MFTLLGVILLFWALLNTPIYISRSYSDITYANTRDGLNGEIYWSTQYKAPLILSKEIKLEAKEKIKLYADVTLKSFFAVRFSHPLSDYRVDQIQIEFDEQDNMQRKFAKILKMEGFENLKNLKPIKIDSVKFGNHQEPDTFTNKMTTLWK